MFVSYSGNDSFLKMFILDNFHSYFSLMTFLISLYIIFLAGIADPEVKPSASEDYEQQLMKGIESFYQTDWVDAQIQFGKLKDKFPDDPRAYFFESMIPFWKYFFVEQNHEYSESFFELSEVAIEKSEIMLKNSPADTTTVMLLSGLYGYRSLVAAGEKEYREAIKSALQGFGYTRKLLSLDDVRPDAYIGRGMFQYMVGNVPRELKWMTNMFGLKGDRELGLNELKKAASSDSYVSVDARMILAYLYRKELDYKTALSYLDSLINEYPANSIFQFTRAEILEEMNRPGPAVDAYQTVINLDNENVEPLLEKSRNRINKLSGLGYSKNKY